MGIVVSKSFLSDHNDKKYLQPSQQFKHFNINVLSQGSDTDLDIKMLFLTQQDWIFVIKCYLLSLRYN